MKSRQLIIVGGIALFGLGVLAYNYIASFKEHSERKAPPPAIRSTEYIQVKNSTVNGKIPITGKLEAKDRIEIYAEVSGNLLASSSNFKEGNRFSAGTALLRIDDSETLLNLQSQRSNFLSALTRILPDLKLDYPEAYPNWKKYVDAFSISKKLSSLPEVQGAEKYFLSTQGVFNQYYAIKSLEARLDKYTITAPFTGTVARASIKAGTLVRAGQKLGEFIKTGVFEMEAPLDVDYLPYIKVGSEVTLKSNQLSGSYTGVVARVSDAIDPSTQSAKVILEMNHPDLKDGMYLNGSILTMPFEKVFVLTKDQINDQNQTFVIKSGKLKAQPIELLFVGENEIITNSLKTGDKVLKAIYAGAFDGAKVKIEGESGSRNNGK